MNQEATVEAGTGSKRPVISIHGIRTQGRWMQELAPELEKGGFEPIPFRYGFFRALQLLWEGSRRKQLDWFLNAYTEVTERYAQTPSIVAHSFGSYLVARCLETFPEVKFDRVILCGSIVSADYPWSDIVLARQQVESVLNDFGRQDFWAGVVGFVVPDAGPSGRQGFSSTAGGRVHQRENPGFRHSDYFHRLNFRENWVPFLKGATPEPVIAVPRGFNWRFALTLLVIGGLLLAAGLRLVAPSDVRSGTDEATVAETAPVFEVLLMDSRYDDYVYSARTRQDGLTNNRDVRRILRELGVDDLRETLVSHAWTDSDRVRETEPDLIVMHLSSFAVPASEDTAERTVQTDGLEALQDFLAVMAPTQTELIVYSRVIPTAENDQEALKELLSGNDPDLARKIHLLPLDGRSENPFDNPANVRRIKNAVRPFKERHEATHSSEP